jgi:hypothetical protein
MGADASPFAGKDQNNPTEQRHGDEPQEAPAAIRLRDT